MIVLLFFLFFLLDNNEIRLSLKLLQNLFAIDCHWRCIINLTNYDYIGCTDMGIFLTKRLLCEIFVVKVANKRIYILLYAYYNVLLCMYINTF